MKKILLLLSIPILLSCIIEPECGDGNTYASKKQTEYDHRFDEFQRINSAPKFNGGQKKLNKLIHSKLQLSEIAKTQIFNLNYQFTITCDGKIEDIKRPGDPKGNDWTNIKEIIESTKGEWKPATKNGKSVACVYFGTFFINGGNY